MSRVVAYLLRFAVIIAGYAFAALAASAFLNLISIGAFDWTAEEAPWVIAGSVLVSIPLAALFVAYFAFVPSAVAILAAELLRRRSWLFYAIAGALIAVGVVVFMRGGADARLATDSRLTLAMIGGGMVGGIAYWLVAGRSAGRWLDRGAADISAPGP